MQLKPNPTFIRIPQKCCKTDHRNAVRWIIRRVDSPLGNPPQLRLIVIGVVR